MQQHNQIKLPNVSFPVAFKTIPICLTIIIILTVGEPDLLDAIIKLILKFAS